MLVVVAPGQGAQSPGFLTPWLDVPGVRERLEWLSVVSGIDLVEHGTTSDADTIKDTAVAQPLIVGPLPPVEVVPLEWFHTADEASQTDDVEALDPLWEVLEFERPNPNVDLLEVLGISTMQV